MTEDDQQRYPLGPPINRPAQNQPIPIDGRPGWFTDHTGRVYYEDPDAPAPSQKGNTR